MNVVTQALKRISQALQMLCFAGVLIFLVGCHAVPQTRKLQSGTEIIILTMGPMHFSNDDTALMLKYQTTLKLDDIPNLRREADEVWAKFRPQVERAGFKAAVLSANDAPRGFILTQNSTYNFVFKQNAESEWHCTNDDKK